MIFLRVNPRDLGIMVVFNDSIDAMAENNASDTTIVAEQENDISNMVDKMTKLLNE